MFWIICYMCAGATAWWYYHVRKIRSKFVNKLSGKLIGGSDNFPFVDYFIHGFMGRNTTAPYGDFELSFFLGFPVVMISDPKVIKELMKGAAVKDFDKGELTLAGVEPFAGRQNLFSSDGLLWQHQRSIINPAFRPMYIQMLTKNVVITIENTIKYWESKKYAPDNLISDISNLTLSIICRAAFGIADSYDNDKIFAYYKNLLNCLIFKMLGLGYFVDGSLNQAAIGIESIAVKVLDRCRAENTTESRDSSLIGLMLFSNQDDDNSADQASKESDNRSGNASKVLTDREIIDNIKVFLFAGHDTTASTILWVLYILALYPAHEIAAYEEVNSIFPNRVYNTEVVTYEKLKSMKGILRVLKETLRLFPPAWAINRSPTKDVVLNGIAIPKGTSIMINTLRLHRRQDIGWDRPFDFVPDRWIEEQEHQAKSAFSYLPFGGGNRTCVGQPLAEIEVLAVLVGIMQKYKPVIIGGKRDDEIDFFAGSTIRPKNAKNLRLVARLN